MKCLFFFFLVLVVSFSNWHIDRQDHFVRISHAETAFSANSLKTLAAYLDPCGSLSVILAHDGKIFFEWRKFHHSFRQKSNA